MANQEQRRSSYPGTNQSNHINTIPTTPGDKSFKPRIGERNSHYSGYVTSIINKTEINQDGGYVSMSLQPGHEKQPIKPVMTETEYISTREYNRNISSRGAGHKPGESHYGYSDFIDNPTASQELVQTQSDEADPIYQHLDSVPLPTRSKKKGLGWLFSGKPKSKSSKDLVSKPKMTKSQTWQSGDAMIGHGSHPNNDTYFDVEAEKTLTELGTCIEGSFRILVTPKTVCLYSLNHELIFTWPFEYIRSTVIIKEENIFKFEVGRKSESGPGVFRFKPKGKYNPDLIANEIHDRILSRQKEKEGVNSSGKSKGKKK